MSTQVKHRRGNDTEVLAGTPAIAELWMNTDDNSMHLGDGITAGGHKIPKVSNRYTSHFDTLAEVVASTDKGRIYEGATVCIGDRAGGVFDVVLASAVTPNTYDIVALTGLPTLALDLQKIKQPFNPLQWGAVDDLVFDNKPVFERMISYTKTLVFGGRITPPNTGAGYMTSQITMQNAYGIKFGGDNAKIQINPAGTNNYIFNMTGSENCEFSGNLFVGASDTRATYDNANRQAGLGIFTSSFIRVVDNVFEKFSSFGIFAQNLNGGTYTEGVFIDKNVFRDCPYDSATSFQCGILLSSDGEYSTITNNRFFRIPSAIRFTDGANSLFAHNIIMQCNGDYDVNAACIYAEYTGGGNGGKLQIINNKINHNETGQLGLRIRNSTSQPMNANIIDGNEFLIHGNPYVSAAEYHTQIAILDDCENAIVVNNVFRPNGGGGPYTVTGESCLRLNNCKNATVDNNYFKCADLSNTGKDYAIHVDGTDTVKIGNNTYDNFQHDATGYVRHELLLSGSANFKYTGGRSLCFKITAAGAASAMPWDDTGFTVTKPAVGHYQMTHALWNFNYTVSVTTDNSALAPERRYSVVRDSASPMTLLDIYVTDGAGAAIDQDIIVTITLGNDNDYLLQ